MKKGMSFPPVEANPAENTVHNACGNLHTKSRDEKDMRIPSAEAKSG
jgi:hypothetical protein